jgi:hypothetical protein
VQARPGNTFAWNPGYSASAGTNRFRYGLGAGAGGYWFMFGPDNKALPLTMH